MRRGDDSALLDGMRALQARLRASGPIRGVPIPGYPANFGTLRLVLLPEDHRNDEDEDDEDEDGEDEDGDDAALANLASAAAGRDSAIDRMGAGVDATHGIVAGFSLNMANQVVEMSDAARQNMMLGGYAFWRGRKRWKLRPGMVSFFIDSDVPLLLRLLQSLRAMGMERGEHDAVAARAAKTQLGFLQDTLQSVRRHLSEDDNEVARLQLRLKILRNSDRESLRLGSDIGTEARVREMKERAERIAAGKIAIHTILSDHTAHVAAIKALVRAQHRSTVAHGRFEDVADVLDKSRPAFVGGTTGAASSDNTRQVAVAGHQLAVSAAPLALADATYHDEFDAAQDFDGIRDLAAYREDRVGFSHYLVTVVSEGGRRLEVNLEHEHVLQDGTGRRDPGATVGMTFDDLRDECCKYWGLMEHKFMMQTDFSMPAPPRGGVRDHLLHLAVSAKILWGEKPRLIGPRDAFKAIDEDHSGQIDVNEFSMLFRRFSDDAQRRSVSVFAEVDVDHSGEITFAEFTEEWERILRFLMADIARDRLPLCYLLPKQVVIGSNVLASAGGTDANGMPTFGNLSNITGADKATLDAALDVGNIQDDKRAENLSASPQLGFEMFDKKKNGTISWHEFKDVFRNINSLDMGDPEVRKEIRDLFNQTNKSRTGAIDFGEFSKNWSFILTKMADHSRIFGENEILKELGQNLGVDGVFEHASMGIPKREATLIREAFVYMILVIILTVCTFENRSVLPSYYMIHRFRQEAMDRRFGGPVWPSNWDGNLHYDRLVQYDRDANNQTWLAGTMPTPVPLVFATVGVAPSPSPTAVLSVNASNATTTNSTTNQTSFQNNTAVPSPSLNEAQEGQKGAGAASRGTEKASAILSTSRVYVPQAHALFESLSDHKTAAVAITADSLRQAMWRQRRTGAAGAMFEQGVLAQGHAYLKALRAANASLSARAKANEGVARSRDYSDQAAAVNAALLLAEVQQTSANAPTPTTTATTWEGFQAGYPAPVLYPARVGDPIVEQRVSAGAQLTSSKAVSTIALVPTRFSSIGEVASWLDGPLRHAIRAVRAEEARENIAAYASNGRARPYDARPVTGRTDIYNNSYINFVAKSVGPGLVLEKRSATKTLSRACAFQKSQDMPLLVEGIGTTTTDESALECPHLDVAIDTEWTQAPQSIVGVGVADSDAEYDATMDRLRASRWLNEDTVAIRARGVQYNPNTNLALAWTVVLEKPGFVGTVFEFKQVKLRVVQIDQLNTPMQRVVAGLLLVALALLGYVIKIEVVRIQRIKIVTGHYSEAMRSLALWSSGFMLVFFVCHLVLRAAYFFNDDRRNFDITSKSLSEGLPPLESLIDIFEVEHALLTVVAALSWFRLLNYLMIARRIWFTLKVLKNSFKKAAYYLVLFLVPLLSYALGGHGMFGSRVTAFSTWYGSLETVVVMTFGTFQEEVLERFPVTGALFLFSFYLVVVFLMRTLFTAIVIDTYKREAVKYEKRPPPVVVWTCAGMRGAICPSCAPRHIILGSDPIGHLNGISSSMAMKLLRFELKTVRQLADLDDRELRLVALKSAFISRKRLLSFRDIAINALSQESKNNMDLRGTPKAVFKRARKGGGGGKEQSSIELV